MKKEYYILCKYLSVKDAGNDNRLQKIYELEFGKINLKDNLFTYISLYIKDTLYFFFQRSPLLRKKLIFLCAMIEASNHYESLIPSKRKKTLIESGFSFSLILLSKAQIFIYKLFNL